MKMSQQSISELPEHQQQRAMDATERASKDYPSVLVKGCLVHVCQIDGEWQVWINCEDADFTGLCVAAHVVRGVAVDRAVRTLIAIAAHLQQQ